MKDNLKFSILLPRIFLFGLLVFLPWYFLSGIIARNQKLEIRRQLAQELGVNIDDFENPYSFPSNYFDSLLQPGMSIAEVHSIVRGYKTVLHCGNTREVYYFFSNMKEDAVRLEFIYSESGQFKWRGGEDSDSHSIFIEGCSPGLISIDP